MKILKKNLKVCSRGHKFYKSSDCPVCPVCWSGYYKKRAQKDFPDKLSAPAVRALHNAKITKLPQLAKYTELELLKLHGLGPNALAKLRKELKSKGLKFAKK